MIARLCGSLSLLLLISACAAAPPSFGQDPPSPSSDEPTVDHDQDHSHGPESRPRVIDEGLSAGERVAVEVVRNTLPTVVTIYTQSRTITDRGAQVGSGVGSGVLISSEGHILTAAHVIDNADRILVKTHDGTQRPARVIDSEPDADVALVQLITPDPTLPHATLGHSSRLAIGQWVFVIGSPNGLESSFSAGHVSAFRHFGSLYNGAVLAEFIQTDAAINSGNSGGPVFDSQGRVVGIASRILTKSGGSEGLGFAVSIDTVRSLLALDDRTWTGLSGTFLDEDTLRLIFQIDAPGGLLIQRVAADSPAAKAGLRGGVVRATIGGRELLLGGDLVLQIGDQAACHAECLANAGERLEAGESVAVQFLRGGKPQEVRLDVSESRRRSVLPKEDQK